MKLGLFIGEKPIFMKKKIRRSAVKNFVRLLFERSKLETSPFGSLKESD
jgi:hypothetical protein